jgi:DNA-binding beta-propeller fold protein YncE
VQTKYKWQVINGNGVDISIGLDPDVHNAGSDAPLESRTITVAKPQGVQAILKWGGWTLATRTLFTGSFSIQHSGNLGFTSAPNGIVWSDHRLFVTDGDNIAVFQEPGLTRIKTIALPPGSGASKMALMPGGRKLYVTNNNDTICVIDTKAMTFLSAVAVPDKLSDAYRPAMSPRGDRVYFPCAWGDQDSHSGLFSMDTVNDSIATVFDYQDVTDVYYSVAVAPDGKTIYSTGTYGKTLTILDATVPNKKIIATLPLPDHVADTGGGQIVISPNGNKLWVAAVADHLYVGNPLTKDPFVDVAAIPGRMINFKGWAGAAAISLIADVIYLATDSMIYVVSIHEDNEILAAIPAGGMDMTIAPADMGETLYLTGGSGLTSVQIRWQS